MNKPSADLPTLPLVRTPHVEMGPFYPLHAIEHACSELWATPRGLADEIPRVELFGQVVNMNGAPIPDALVEIWQADEHGVYRHPASRDPAPNDPSFAGYGVARTDARGHFRFGTRRPGPYGSSTSPRAPHIHFQVTTAQQRLVTQMFFPDETSNTRDRCYCAARDARHLVAQLWRSAPELIELRWQIVLAAS